MESQLIARIEALEAALAEERKRVDAVYNVIEDFLKLKEQREQNLEDHPPRTPSENEIIGRGKHKEKTRRWVVENDPAYVLYLSGLGPHVLPKWGFTEEHLREAMANDAALRD